MKPLQAGIGKRSAGSGVRILGKMYGKGESKICDVMGSEVF